MGRAERPVIGQALSEVEEQLSRARAQARTAAAAIIDGADSTDVALALFEAIDRLAKAIEALT